jgi:4-amino-4-deoxy-L-arabinose transferase-like glycosyltransferase
MPGFRRTLAALLAFALVLRLAYVLIPPTHRLVFDEIYYDDVATHLVEGRGFAQDRPTAWTTPLYPIFLAGVYRVFGHSIAAVGIIQSCLDLLSIVLLVALTRRLWPDPRVALTAVALLAIYPPFLMDCRALLTMALYTPLLVGAVIVTLSMVRGETSSARALAVGLLCGLATQTRPATSLLAVALAGFIALDPVRRRRLRVREAAVLVLVTVLVQVPWTIRNWRTFHAFIPTATLAGRTFWMGTPAGPGGTTPNLLPGRASERVLRAVDSLSAVEGDRFLYREGLRTIAAYPGKYAVLAGAKVLRLWLNLGYDDPPSRRTLALAAVNLCLMVLAGLGFAGLPPPLRREALAVVVTAAYFTAVHAASYALVAHSFPLFALLMPFSAAGVIRVFGGARRRATDLASAC